MQARVKALDPRRIETLSYGEQPLVDWVMQRTHGIGADIVIDYKKDDFETIVRDCDMVLDTLGGVTLEKSLRVLKPGGKLIGIAGPPDPEFAKEIGSSWFLKLVMHILSYRIRRKARRHHVTYSFLFMRASGDQLRESAALIDSGAIRPGVD